MKKVYTCFCTDVIHAGHLNVISNALRYGEVTVGALTDEELIRYNKFPILSLDERIRLYQQIPGVSKVVVQTSMHYDEIVKELKPDYVIHGDNWKEGAASVIREQLIKTLKEYGGDLIEVPYTWDETVEKIDKSQKEKLAMPEYRRKRLKQLIKICPIVKTIEAHSGLTGLIAEKTVVDTGDGKLDQFDAMWVSSLCDSTAKGKPDIELVQLGSKCITIPTAKDITMTIPVHTTKKREREREGIRKGVKTESNKMINKIRG